MYHDLIKTIKSSLRCGDAEARSRLDSFLSENQSLILAMTTSEPVRPRYGILPRLFSNLDDALRHRYEVTGVPEYYGTGITDSGPSMWRYSFPLAIIKASIFYDGELVNKEAYAMARDLIEMEDRGYGVRADNTVAGVYGLMVHQELCQRGIPINEYWSQGFDNWDTSCITEWFGHDGNYHISEPGTPMPNNVSIHRRYKPRQEV